MILGHGGGDRAHQELGLVHAGIVGPHRVDLEIDGAVEEPDLGVLEGGREGFLHHGRGGREDDLILVRDRALDGVADLLVGSAVLEENGLHKPPERLGELAAAQLMGVDPGRVLARPLVDEGDPHGIGLCVGGRAG